MHRREIADSLRDKIIEAGERAAHLARLVPRDSLAWQPSTGNGQTPMMDLGHLLGHILEALAGFCAALSAAFPARAGEMAALRSLPVNHACTPEEAVERIADYLKHIWSGFADCTDDDLARKVPTVFVPEGEALATILLGNLEHLVNHKHQLFFYLRLLGVSARTQDLYRLRGSGAGSES